jgi:Cu(I)/Ag(I) efflux system membrane fusion protein
MAWMEELASIKTGADRIAEADGIADARVAFDPLSQSLIRVAQMFGTSGREPVLLFTCSMAFDGRGADWLQNKPGVENPYWGSAMFKCGEQLQVIHPGSEHSGHSHD